MRPSVLALAFIPLLAAALPPTDLAASSRSSAITFPAGPPPSSAQAAIVSEQEVKREKPWEESVTTALVVLPCRGCGTDGADEFFTLNFTASPQEYSQCRHVPFTINGVVAEVRESRRESTRTASVNINVQGRDLALTAELFCGLASHTIIPLEDKYWVPTIDIKLDSVDHKSLHESPIFRITIRQWPFLRLTDLKVSYQVIENDHLTWATNGKWYHDNDLNRNREDAIGLLETLDWARQVFIDTLKFAADKPLPPTPAVDSKQDYRPQGVRQRMSDHANRLSDNFDERIAEYLDRMDDKFGPETTDRLVGERPLVRLLKILAAAIGLTALISSIRRRFSSLRRKVDRLAAREERQAARAYRRAARQEYHRQQWQKFKGMFSRAGRVTDDEEKKGLILAAQEEGMIDEKQMYESEIALMLEAHGIASAMVQCQPQHIRLRSDSLPSYRSEPLPGYSSRPRSDDGIADGFRPSSIASNRSSAGTPDSSIPDVSSRYSDEISWTGNEKP